MSYPVVTIFTRKHCGGCTQFMKGYREFKEDVRKISQSAKIHIITYDTNWTTRIYTENYGYTDIINNQPGPDLDHLEFAPMIAVVRSDNMKDGSKYLVNGATYQPKQRIFSQTKGENLRVWLAKSIREVENDIANNPFSFQKIESQNQQFKPAPKPMVAQNLKSIPQQSNTNEDIGKKVETLINRSKPKSMLDTSDTRMTYSASKGPRKFHFEMVDTN